ncbi:putative Histone-lysine N-methyltransferase ASHR1 [Hypsibius exemplaris]|uniref:Histone-lysine N-methyltransferase ASHR1 n=1 Tax=Hypsibius exemplaris TaxID=2072580 RepID=A0A1W0WEE2_HYPEX|nr:putative Histone-lysine N-methyltransferase ASHR1 [Hypsibius exemplaris]
MAPARGVFIDFVWRLGRKPEWRAEAGRVNIQQGALRGVAFVSNGRVKVEVESAVGWKWNPQYGGSGIGGWVEVESALFIYRVFWEKICEALEFDLDLEMAGDPEMEMEKSSFSDFDFTVDNTYGLNSYADLLSIEGEDTSAWTYKPGDIVMEEVPYASAVSLSSAASICHSCFQMEKADSKLKRCARCKFARYCHDECAKKAWPVHKLECGLLANYFAAVGFFPDGLIRLVNLVMIKVWRGQMTMPADSCCPPTDREFDSLCSHTQEIDEELASSEKFKVNMQEMKKFMGAEVLLEIGEDIVAEVYSRVVTNTISIADRDGVQLGIGLYFGISQFDHSCVPNALFFTRSDAPKVQVVAVAPIKALADVRIAYIDPSKPTQQRRAELKESYYFSCSCNRCHSIERDGMARSLVCPSKRCEGFILLGKDWLPLGPCQRCDSVLEQSSPVLRDSQELMTAIEDFLDANAASLRFIPGSTPDTQLLELLLGLESVASTALFKLNYYRLLLNSFLVQYYVTGDVRKALSLQMDLLEGYRFNLGPVSLPALSALMEAAEWSRGMGDYQTLLKFLKEATRMGEIIFGRNDAPFLSRLAGLRVGSEVG